MLLINKKTGFFRKRGGEAKRACATVEVSKATNVNIYSLTLWYSVPQVQEIGNCAIFLNYFYTRGYPKVYLLNETT